MNGKLTAFKNIMWTLGILLCLLALLVGFLFAAFSKYDGSGQIAEPTARPQVPAQEEVPEDFPEDVFTVSAELQSLTETADGGQDYIDSLTFLCDSALIGLRDYGLLSGGHTTSQVWGSEAGNIPAPTLADFTIKYPGDGSQITPAAAAMVTRPSILVLSLGVDSMANVKEEDFIAGYTALINSIRSASPDTKIVCCSLTGVTIDYAGADGLDTNKTNRTNDWIRTVCTDTGAYFADVGSAVTDSSGALYTEYAGVNGKALNMTGLAEVLNYLSTHMVP